MRQTLTVASKDFRSLVTSPMFCIAAGASALLMSYSYLRNLKQFSESSLMGAMQYGAENGANIQFTVFMGHLSITNLLFVLITPAITMRLLAEERKMRTYDLLLTAPITATDIALGKFLAGFGGILVLTLISLLFPLMTRAVADFSVKQLLISYLGLGLVTGTYVAVGVFSSSLTESVLLAVVLGWLLNLCLWFLAQGADFFEGSKFVAVMEHLSIGQHFANFVRGTLNVSSFVFLLSCIAFFVFLTQRVVESSRWR
ncbi:MAG: ABC transporter permease subunit [Bdellovibrionales bacterium]|nr:ABC transporter permease subunit [Bdellovibrionales bacterium]